MQRLLFATMIALLTGAAAPAEESSAPPGAGPPADAAAVGAPATGEGASGVAPERSTSAHGPHSPMDDYIRLLAAEVRRRTRDHVFLIAGSADVAFTIGAAGRVVDYKLLSVTEGRKVESAVRLIMAAIRMPPPPGGSFETRQEFRFSNMSRGPSAVDPGGSAPRPTPSFDTWKDYRFSGESPSRQRKAYLVMMSSALEKRRRTGPSPKGVFTIFHVNASGRVDDVKIACSRNPKEAKLARELLYGLQAPPPPGGAIRIHVAFAERIDQPTPPQSPRAFCNALARGAN
jgi:hypothetical protein